MEQHHMLLNFISQETFNTEIGSVDKALKKKGTSVPIISLQKHLGYFNHIFRLSQLHQCDQELLPNRFSWKFSERAFSLVH